MKKMNKNLREVSIKSRHSYCLPDVSVVTYRLEEASAVVTNDFTLNNLLTGPLLA